MDNNPVNSAVVKRLDSHTCEWAGCSESAEYILKVKMYSAYVCEKHLKVWKKENPDLNTGQVYSEEPTIQLNNYGLFRSKSVAEVNQGHGFNNFRDFGKESKPNFKEEDSERKERIRLQKEAHNVTVDLEIMVAEELWYLSLDNEKVPVKTPYGRYIRIFDEERNLYIYYTLTGTPVFLMESNKEVTFLSYV